MQPYLTFLALPALVLAGAAVAAPAGADLLVLMHGSGTIERYDSESGAHLGTLAAGLTAPNALLEGTDGRLYVSTGVPGGHGTVERFEARTGRRLGPFISIPAGQPGHLARATGLAWLEGDLLVASQGDGRVKRFDGRTGAWKADVASASPGGLTQIAVQGAQLFLTDFVTPALRRSDLSGSAALAPVWAAAAGSAPWGLVFAADGRVFWSTNANHIRCGDGTASSFWAGAAGGLNTPVWLTIGPDGLLYAASLYGNRVSVWDTAAANPGAPLRQIGGTEMQSPISLAFCTVAFEPPTQIGNFVAKPSNTGRDWTPDGTTVYNLGALASTAALPIFGLDTEGGDRAKTNLLKEPIRLLFTLADGGRVDSADIEAVSAVTPNRVRYTLTPLAGTAVDWQVWLDGQQLWMSFALSGPAAACVASVQLLIPFDPRAMGTTVLAEEWGSEGAVKAPLIISALDMGQLRLSNAGADERLDGLFTGSRLHKRLDLRIGVLGGATSTRRIVFAPARLEKPSTDLTDAAWARIRRGLISLIQITPYMKAQEDGSGWLGSPGGITGNNVISDPVSVNMDRNLQWLAGMGDKATIMGINLQRIARRTLEFWLNQRQNPDGSLDYVLQTGNISADANPGVLNAATDYYLSTGDRQFVTANRDVLIKAVNYLTARDLDQDGLIETFRDGNGNNQFGDTGYDTISSGWKNALVNGQAYKSLLGVARMLADTGEAELAQRYRQQAVRLRQEYNRQFYDAAKGRYLWWIGQDGKRHDYGNPLIQENAVLFGIADGLEQDTGIRRGAREVMQQLWNDLAAAQYVDSAQGKTVKYIDPQNGDYTGFYWGIPCNLEDVPDAYNFQSYGAYEFPYYCNGGIFPQDTVAAIMAFSSAGMTEQAELIRRQIFRRQHEGILPNGSGFYMGVVNEPGKCYSILKWDGTPTDYEGIISRDCAFLQTAILSEDPARALFAELVSRPPAAGVEPRELFRDTAFAEGFGAGWPFGSQFTLSTERKEGVVTAYREIRPWQVHLIPEGPVATASVKEHPWDFEEGVHMNFKEGDGTIAELYAHRLAAEHRLERNTPEALQVAQFNNYGLAETDPRRDTRLVKRVTSDRRGRITLYYDSQNEIRNVATNYIPQFALDTWPTFLLLQTFRDLPKLADYSALNLALSFEITQLTQRSDWPAGLPGAASADMNWQFYFLLREIKHPERTLWVGMLLYPSNPQNCFVHTTVDQWGIAMHREPFMPAGQAPALGQRYTIQRDLKDFVRAALLASAAKQPDKQLSVHPDDYYLHLFNIGWEGIGHWQAECALSGLSLQGVPRMKTPAPAVP